MKKETGHPLFVRNAPTVTVPDQEIEPNTKFLLVALTRIHRALQAIARSTIDLTKSVDEYSIVTAGIGGSTSTVEVLPQFDTINERIESIIITGPVSTAFNLQLGDRFWTMTTDATGKVSMGPVGLLLSRNDRRILTSVTAGNWTLELMGHADERF